MERARPTLRCLRDDLHLPIPPARQPLDEVEHPQCESRIAPDMLEAAACCDNHRGWIP